MHRKIAIAVLSVALLIPTLAYAATYYVQKGDSLFKIGQRYGVSSEYVRQTNGLQSIVIYPGQKLWVPDQKVDAVNYTVQKGDTLYSLGQKYGVLPQEIMAATGLKSDYLEQGQALLIPKKGSAKPVTYAKAAQNDAKDAAVPAKLASRDGSTAELRQEVKNNKISAEEFELLAKIVYGESRGEPYKGQVAVAAVVLNRVKSPLFPNTIRGVIFQPGAFTAVVDGQAYLNPDETAYKAAKAALDGWDPTNGAMYYWNPAKSTSKWIWSKPIKMRIGSHVFADQ